MMFNDLYQRMRSPFSDDVPLLGWGNLAGLPPEAGDDLPSGDDAHLE